MPSSAWKLPRRLTADPADAIAVALLCALAILSGLTFSDYGLGWDDFTHSEYGELLLRYYRSHFSDRTAFSFVNLFYYGGGFDLIAAILAKVLPLELFDVRRLLGAAIGLVGFFLVWRTGRRLAGPVGGLAALSLLAICPLYYGQMFMNAKDAPFAVAMLGVTYALVRAFDEYPRPTPRTVALFGACLGFAIGARVLGLLAGANLVLALGVLLVLEARTRGFGSAAQRGAGFVALLALGLPLGYFMLAVVWPWAVVEPSNPLVALKYYSHFWEVPWREMFEGQAISVPDMPRRYVPTLFALQMPEMFLGLCLLGAGWAALRVVRGSETPQARARYVLLLSAVLVPIALVMATRPAMYNGIRHFVFVTPAMALLGGVAVAGLWNLLARAPAPARAAAAAAFALGLGAPAATFRDIHPYEYTYYNNLVGGVRGADDKFMIDYWGLAFKQAAEELDKYVETHRALLPQGRKLRVAVCGPLLAAKAEFGPQFELTYDSKNADLALVQGEFHCADVKAPVIVEVAREGVVYARVYDVRGRQLQSIVAGP
ncbi:glycosyltransferase family 39 protein [Xanthobacter sp. KR7-225]|uniref:glycosyltransferase family 39 protein n=1 Tax=Xanthobacter sp. KR7-225 TaxID=3156613 RepID=UPI0032B3BE87